MLTLIDRWLPILFIQLSTDLWEYCGSLFKPSVHLHSGLECGRIQQLVLFSLFFLEQAVLAAESVWLCGSNNATLITIYERYFNRWYFTRWDCQRRLWWKFVQMLRLSCGMIKMVGIRKEWIRRTAEVKQTSEKKRTWFDDGPRTDSEYSTGRRMGYMETCWRFADFLQQYM